MVEATLADYFELHRRQMKVISRLVELGKYVESMYEMEMFFSDVFTDFESLKRAIEISEEMLLKGEW